MSFSYSVYEMLQMQQIQTQIFFGLDHNMKKSMIITIFCDNLILDVKLPRRIPKPGLERFRFYNLFATVSGATSSRPPFQRHARTNPEYSHRETSCCGHRLGVLALLLYVPPAG